VTFADAVLARLVEVLPSSVGVYDTQVPGIPQADSDGVGRYVVLYPISGQRSVSGAAGASNDLSVTVQATSVAWFANASDSPAPECRWVAEQVRDALTDWVPPIDGFGPVLHTLSRPGASDEKIRDRPAVYAVDQFSVLADRIS
jgi:hypothetical protein